MSPYERMRDRYEHDPALRTMVDARRWVTFILRRERCETPPCWPV